MYGRDLANFHRLGSGFHAGASAAGILALLDSGPFVDAGDDSWRRDDERHENVLVDTAGVVATLAGHGVQAAVRGSFGGEQLPESLVAVVGRKL